MAQPALEPTSCREGLDALRGGNGRDASAKLTQCLQLDLPDPVRAYILQSRARAYRLLAYGPAALQDQQASLKLVKPFDVWPWIDLAIYHRALKQYDEALAALKQALAYDEDGPGTGAGMGVFYQTGITLTLLRRYSEAIEAFDKGIPKQPKYGHAYFARALAHESLSHAQQAKADMMKAAELIPPSEYTAFMVGKLKQYNAPVKSQPR